ncbi:MAG TPA: Asp-tRNA(Asn)/Glu-tRNA(Gln) amidotransferase GatCAB subunit C [Solibacterales bacterium]|nr:Asp-tRNA(Asn)/Glu-tRNA(Gln) amidotransferase GatCAB subunit C [Bryobacterales bacterium]
MKITENEVRYIAGLANLNLSGEEVTRLRADLDGILSYIDKLNELDLNGVEPMAQVLYQAEESATLRPDVERPGLGGPAATANAPLAAGGFFKVPKVVEK